MHKIDHPTAAPGGLFTEGDPVSAVPATVVTGDWLNAVQLEIANAVEGAGLTARSLGETVGAETHTLSQAEMPSHTHTGGNTINNGSGYSVIGAGGTNVAMGPLTTSSAGSGAAHNNMQPTTFLHAHIKL